MICCENKFIFDKLSLGIFPIAAGAMDLTLDNRLRKWCIVGLLMSFSSMLAWSQSSAIEELKQNFVSADHDTVRSRALYLLMYEFFESSLDSAYVYAKRNLDLLKATEYPKFRCTALSGMGSTFMYMNRYDSAQYYFEEALKVTEQFHLPAQRSALYTNFGVLFKRQGFYDEAIQSYIDGLIEDERSGNLYGEIIKKVNISNLYGLLKDNDKALQYGLEALADCEDLEHSDKALIQGLLLNNIGTIYVEELQFDQAIENFRAALVISRATENNNEIARNLHNIGLLYEKIDSTIVGLPLLLEAQRIRTEVGDDVGLIETNMQLGSSFGKLGMRDSSRYYFNEALHSAIAIKNHGLTSQTYLAMSESDVINNDFEQALENHKLSVSYQDSLDEKYDRDAYLEMESKYRAAQKDVQISQQELLISKRTSQRNNYLFGALALLLIAGFVLYRSQQTRKLSDEKIRNLEQQQKLLALDYMLQGQEEERKRIARDLHDGLGGLLSSASLQMQNIQKEIDKLSELSLFNKAEKMIDNACREVRRIAHDMMPSALIDLGLMDAVEDLADKIRIQGNLIVNVKSDFDESVLSDAQSVNLYRIVQEFCNNTIKHAKASEINLTFTKDNQKLLVDLSDNGIGYDRADQNLHEGIGLKSMESRTKYLGGEFNDRTVPGKGCRYIMMIPLE